MIRPGVISFLKDLKRGIKDLMSLGCMAFTSLLPRDRSLALFGAWEGHQYADNPRVLYLLFLELYPGKRGIWLTSEKAIAMELQEQGLPVCMNGSFRAAFLKLRAGYVILSNSFRDVGGSALLGGAKVLNVWHGIPIKRIGIPEGRFRKWVYLRKRGLTRYSFVSSSPGVTAQFKKGFLLSDTHIREWGQARNDVFYLPHRNPIRESFSGMRTIVYMPTFRGDWMKSPVMDLSNILDLPAIDEFCGRNGMVFLIKFHKWTRFSPIGNYRSVKVLENHPDAQLTLDAADILITDYSGCFIDHLLLDRPQIFFAYDLQQYLSADLGFQYDYKEIVPGPVCLDGNQLMNELEALASGEDPCRDKRRQRLDYFYSKENRGPVARKQLEKFLCQE